VLETRVAEFSWVAWGLVRKERLECLIMDLLYFWCPIVLLEESREELGFIEIGWLILYLWANNSTW